MALKGLETSLGRRSHLLALLHSASCVFQSEVAMKESGYESQVGVLTWASLYLQLLPTSPWNPRGGAQQTHIEGMLAAQHGSGVGH